MRVTGGEIGDRLMAKRKQPEEQSVDQYVEKEEDIVVPGSEETSVPVGEAPKEGLLADEPTGMGGSLRVTDNPTGVATAEPVEGAPWNWEPSGPYWQMPDILFGR